MTALVVPETEAVVFFELALQLEEPVRGGTGTDSTFTTWEVPCFVGRGWDGPLATWLVVTRHVSRGRGESWSAKLGWCAAARAASGPVSSSVEVSGRTLADAVAALEQNLQVTWSILMDLGFGEAV